MAKKSKNVDYKPEDIMYPNQNIVSNDLVKEMIDLIKEMRGVQ